MAGTKRLRYSLAALLCILVLFSVIFAAYRTGLEHGYARGFVGGERQWSSKHPYQDDHQIAEVLGAARSEGAANDAVAHRVADSVGTLMTALQTNVARDYWENVGGPYSMTPSRNKESLRVYATRDVHEEVNALLSDPDAAQKAMRDAERARQERLAAQEAAVGSYLAKALSPVEEKLNRKFNPISADKDLSGTWNVANHSSNMGVPASFEFLPPDKGGRGGGMHMIGGGGGGTVEIRTPGNQVLEIRKEYYRTSKGSLIIGSDFYHAGTDDAGRLVLVDQKDATKVLLATKQ